MGGSSQVLLPVCRVTIPEMATDNIKDLPSIGSLQPSLMDLQSVATDIKESLSAAIAELRIDIRDIANRVQDVEVSTAQHDTVLRRMAIKLDAHTLQMRDLQRHAEDLENRGRRHNI